MLDACFCLFTLKNVNTIQMESISLEKKHPLSPEPFVRDFLSLRNKQIIIELLDYLFSTLGVYVFLANQSEATKIENDDIQFWKFQNHVLIIWSQFWLTGGQRNQRIEIESIKNNCFWQILRSISIFIYNTTISLFCVLLYLSRFICGSPTKFKNTLYQIAKSCQNWTFYKKFFRVQSKSFTPLSKQNSQNPVKKLILEMIVSPSPLLC